jgi:hypothetical protein
MTQKRKPRRASKKTAIRNALVHLGWHAKGRDVVAYLANFGIEVNEGLVSKVKVEGIKQPREVRQFREEIKAVDKRRKRPMLRKIPQQREYRR